MIKELDLRHTRINWMAGWIKNAIYEQIPQFKGSLAPWWIKKDRWRTQLNTAQICANLLYSMRSFRRKFHGHEYYAWMNLLCLDEANHWGNRLPLRVYIKQDSSQKHEFPQGVNRNRTGSKRVVRIDIIIKLWPSFKKFHFLGQSVFRVPV